VKLAVSDANLAKFLSVDDFDLSRFDYLNAEVFSNWGF
jgi:hypothetical protein